MDQILNGQYKPIKIDEENTEARRDIWNVIEGSSK